MTTFALVFQGGKLNQQVTSVTLVNNTAKTIDTTVPAGKRWLLLGIKMNNSDSVARDVSMRIYKQAAKTNLVHELGIFSAVAAGATRVWPNVVTGVHFSQAWFPIILEAGNTIQTQWATGGASAGGTDADGLVVEELEIDA